MVRIILIILIIIGIGFFLWNISLNKEELNTKNLAPQSKNNEARSVLSPELGGKITFPSDAPTKNISTSTLTTLDVSYIFPDKAVHYAILKIPDATVNVRCDLSIIRAVVNRGTIRALRCYPIENKERQSINETRIIKNISGDFEIQNVTKNITAYYTTGTVQRINTATQRNYIIEFETEPFAQGFYNLSVGLFNFDPDISACGTLNSNDTVYTLTTDIIDSSSTCFTVDGVNITFDGQGHIVDGQKQTYTRGFHILANSKNFSLKNVVVRDWESGFLDDQSLGYNQINNVTFFNNTDGIATLNGKNNTIKNVIVRNSSGIGIKIFYGYPNYGNFYFENVTNELEYNGTEQKWHSEQVHNISSKHNRGWFPRLTSDGLDANTQANTAWYNGSDGGMNSDLTPNSSLKYWYNNQNITETGGGEGTPQKKIKVQRGTATISASTATTIDVPIEAVNTSKSLVLISTRSATAGTMAVLSWTGVLTNSTNLQLQRSGTTSATVNIEWQVIENDDFFVQAGTSTTSGTQAAITIDLPTPVNLSRSFVVLSCRSSSTTASQMPRCFWTAQFVNQTRVLLTRVSTTTVATVAWQVVDWVGANVQSGSTAATTTPATANINSVNLSRSFIYITKNHSAATGNTIDTMARAYFNNETQIAVHRGGTTGTTVVSWFVVSHPDIITQRGHNSFSASTTQDVAINSVNTSSTFSVSSEITPTTASTNYHQVFMTSNISNSTNLQLKKDAATSTINSSWFVIEFLLQDTQPPQWFDNQTNSTIAGTSINHSVRWTDNTDLSGYIFSFDNGTGTFVNDSFVSFKGVQNFSNVVKIVNSTIGSLIRWRVYANDTSGNMNVTDIFSYVTTSSNSAPTIPFVQPISAQNPTESSTTRITFNFTARDTNGASDINVSSAKAYFQRSGQPTRSNLSCVNLTTSGNEINFSCSIDMWYFDQAGSWTINVTIEDINNAQGENSSTTFTFNTLTAMVMSPTSLTWPTITPTNTDIGSNNDPITINNTGNAEPLSINITAYNLRGETLITKFIFANNFTVQNSSEGCSGTIMQNATSINVTSARLFRGNNSLNYNNETSGQEQIFFCLKGVPQDATAQSYSTAGSAAWEIKVLLAPLVYTRRKRRNIQKLENDELLKAMDIILEELRKEYSLNKKELVEILIKKLRDRYKVSKKDILSLIRTEEELEIPLSIFSSKVGALESLVKYMKENLRMSYREIANRLKRNERTIWTSYKKANEKQKEAIKISDVKNYIPLSHLIKENLTVLESAILYLKNKEFSFKEIADLLHRDQRNIWTIYSRIKKKYIIQNE